MSLETFCIFFSSRPWFIRVFFSSDSETSLSYQWMQDTRHLIHEYSNFLDEDTLKFQSVKFNMREQPQYNMCVIWNFFATIASFCSGHNHKKPSQISFRPFFYDFIIFYYSSIAILFTFAFDLSVPNNVWSSNTSYRLMSVTFMFLVNYCYLFAIQLAYSCDETTKRNKNRCIHVCDIVFVSVPE